MSQLAFMIALVRQTIRDPLTGVFSRCSGEESLDLHSPSPSAAMRAEPRLSSISIISRALTTASAMKPATWF